MRYLSKFLFYFMSIYDPYGIHNYDPSISRYGQVIQSRPMVWSNTPTTRSETVSAVPQLKRLGYQVYAPNEPIPVEKTLMSDYICSFDHDFPFAYENRLETSPVTLYFHEVWDKFYNSFSDVWNIPINDITGVVFYIDVLDVTLRRFSPVYRSPRPDLHIRFGEEDDFQWAAASSGLDFEEGPFLQLHFKDEDFYRKLGYQTYVGNTHGVINMDGIKSVATGTPFLHTQEFTASNPSLVDILKNKDYDNFDPLLMQMWWPSIPEVDPPVLTIGSWLTFRMNLSIIYSSFE